MSASWEVSQNVKKEAVMGKFGRNTMLAVLVLVGLIPAAGWANI